MRVKMIFLLLLLASYCDAQYMNILMNLGIQYSDYDSVIKSLVKNMDTFRSLANSLISSGLESLPDNVTSTLCAQHVELYLEALLRQEEWAVRMFDATGKPSSDIKDYSYKWIGNYDECVAVKATKYDDLTKKAVATHPYAAKYCMVSFALKASTLGALQANLGVCFPETCSNADVAGLVNTIVKKLPVNTSIPDAEVNCKERELPLTDDAKASVIVCSVFLAIMLMATLYDVIIRNLSPSRQPSVDVLESSRNKNFDGEHKEFTDMDKISHVTNGKILQTPLQNGRPVSNFYVTNHLEMSQLRTSKSETEDDIKQSEKEAVKNMAHKADLEAAAQHLPVYKPGAFGRLLLSFSVYTNASKILATKQPSGTLACVNGIRFLSMSWVILGHFVSFGLDTLENVATYMQTLLRRFTFQAVSNATFSVDTFFVLSGLLVSYLTLKEMKKRGGPKRTNWFMFYFHRIWRLTPPYMLFLMLYSTTFRYLGEGPFWVQEGHDRTACRRAWWKNLLYINNFNTDPNGWCIGWSWYLANDMQFYVISPLFLIPLFYSRIIGTICCTVFIIGCIVSRAIISIHYGFGPNLLFNENRDKVFTEMYFKPWARIGPYLVGMWTGYLLYKTKCKAKLSKKVVFVGWALSVATALAVLYGLYTETGIPDLTKEVAAFYNAVSRTAWGACVAWLVFACVSGYGGPINKLLSWKVFVPLGRLTYFAYLVHPVVLFFYFNTRKATLYFDDIELVFLYLGVLSVCYAVSFVLSLAFESPMMGLEKILLGRSKHS